MSESTILYIVVALFSGIFGTILTILYSITYRKLETIKQDSTMMARIKEQTINNTKEIVDIKNNYMTKELCISKEEHTETKLENIIKTLTEIKHKVNVIYENGNKKKEG